MIDIKELRKRQALPLDEKVKLSLERIQTWYEYWEGNVYVAFSGGKDSTVLLDLVRGIYPDVRGCFIDTGLEYPEIKKFVKTFENIDIVKPTMPFNKVLKKYGYPVVSKEVSMAISRFRNSSNLKVKIDRLHGQHGTIPHRWRYLINAPFKISDECCNIMKKGPAHKYGRKTQTYPMLGMMAKDSRLREQGYLKGGCHMISLKHPVSWPMAFWTEADIWNYLRSRNVSYCKIYDMGVNRTGCMFCMFGVHLGSEPNKFQAMAKTHPKHYKFCMNKLGLRKVLSHMNVPYKPYEQKKLGEFE